MDDNERLHQIKNYGMARRLIISMYKNWEIVLRNIPNLPLNPLEIEQFLGTIDIRGQNPVEAMFGVLGRRGVTVKDLKKSFEIIQFEEGLRIVGYPQQQLQSTAEFDKKIIYKAVGSPLELKCISTGFPYPQHVFHKNGYPIFTGNPFTIQNIR